MPFRPTAGRCGASRPRPGACCSIWRRTRFAVPVDQLTVSDGVIAVEGGPTKKVTYGELIGGKRFNVTLTGNDIDATTGVAKVKPVQDLKIVGQSPQRYDIPQGGRIAEMGRGCEAAGHGARAQREAAGRRREADQHRRVIGAQACPGSSKW